MAEVTKKEKTDFIKFLGTAGARFVMIKQLRASGGLWIRCSGTNVLVDPGPGSLVRCASSRPKLDPSVLDGILLTHRHLDHSGDINAMIEAMTEGGFKKKGTVFCPSDAIDEDPVILKYASGFPEKIEIIKARRRYAVGSFVFNTSMKHVHPAETYGFKFKIGGKSVSFITDTKYFKGLNDFYKTDIVIIAVVFHEPRPAIDHLSLPDAEALIRAIRPKRAILTHFGMTMLKARPHIIAERLSQDSGIRVEAAYDGMTLEF